MNTKKLTIVWLQQTISDIQTRRDNGSISWDDEREKILQAFEIALAAMGSEPVGKPFMYGIADPDGNAYIDELCVSKDFGLVEDTVNELNYDREDGDEPNYSVVPLYRHAQPAPERDKVRYEHAEWSQATFGNVGPVGPLKHLSKEALETAAEPGDLSEWADMQFLLWDAQRRAGITDEQITQAMIEKLAVNKTRQWPEPKDGEPRLHINQEAGK